MKNHGNEIIKYKIKKIPNKSIIEALGQVRPLNPQKLYGKGNT